MENSNEYKRAIIALISGAIIIGSSPVLIKAASAPGIVTSFYRMSIGAIILFVPFLIVVKKRKSEISRDGVMLSILGGICFGIDMSVWSTGIVASNATIPTISANMAPVWAGLGAWLFLKEKVHKGFWIGIFIAFIGVSIMLLKDFGISNGVVKGFVHGLIAGVFYGIYYLITQQGRKRISTIGFLFISSLTSSVVLFIVMIIFNYSFFGYDSNTYYLFIIYGVVVQVVGWWLINYSQGYLRAIVVSPILLGQPVVTALIAYLILKEEHSLLNIVGGVVVLLGIYIVNMTRLRK
ncbi:MAG: DMT family transporter [Marinilabiliaceae bacterium]|nr:DMT family transporter [Marinilabiliaceae bacterium]